MRNRSAIHSRILDFHRHISKHPNTSSIPEGVLDYARKHHDIRGDALSTWLPSRWPMMSLDQRRAAVATVLRSVTVLPLPPGRSRRAPFDPTLPQITLVT
jgi:hypothetical protein